MGDLYIILLLGFASVALSTSAKLLNEIQKSSQVLEQYNAPAMEEDSKNSTSPTALEEAWSGFKSQFKKEYSSEEEMVRRKQIFADNLKFIERHNYLESVGLRTFTVAVNKFADLERKEFSALMNGYRKINSTESDDQESTYMSPINNKTIPDEWDWREHGYVTDVKDQKTCGSCWAFSATGSLEGQTFRKTGKLVSLSEQQLVDCTYECFGCEGGWSHVAFNYIKRNRGLDLEKFYPYENKEGRCRYNKENKGATVSGFVKVPENETSVKEAVATIGPLSVAIDTTPPSFQFYKSGVYYDPDCTEQPNHAVLVVGYGNLYGQEYWLIKNSWGETWGDGGYILMARNRDNNCLIASDVTYPLV